MKRKKNDYVSHQINGVHAAILVVYHAFLEREKMHCFNRWFLVFSLSIPLLTIQISGPAQLSDQISEINRRLTDHSPSHTLQATPKNFDTEREADSEFPYVPLLIGIYGLISAILLIRDSPQLFSLHFC